MQLQRRPFFDTHKYTFQYIFEVIEESLGEHIFATCQENFMIFVADCLIALIRDPKAFCLSRNTAVSLILHNEVAFLKCKHISRTKQFQGSRGQRFENQELNALC